MELHKASCSHNAQVGLGTKVHSTAPALVQSPPPELQSDRR